jgi:DNA-binding CsgD family transcriptional regulator
MRAEKNRQFLRGTDIEVGEPGTLSARQTESLYYIAEGYTSEDTAVAMGIAPRTVNDYITGAMTKTNSRNRAHLVRNAFTLGILRESIKQRGMASLSAIYLMIALTLGTLVLDHSLVRTRSKPSKVRSQTTYRLGRSGRNGRGRREELLEEPFTTWGNDHD